MVGVLGNDVRGKGPHGKKSVVLGIANEYSIAYEDVFTKSFYGAEKVQ